MKRSSYGMMLLFTSTTVFATYGILSRFTEEAFPLFYGNVIRCIVALLCYLTIFLFQRKWTSLSHSDAFWITARATAGTVAFIMFFLAVTHLPVGTTYFIFFTGSTLGGYALGFLLFKEKFTRMKIFSLVLAILGISFIYKTEISISLIQYAQFALLAGIFGAIWNTFAKKVSPNVPITQINILDSVVSGVLSLIGFFLLRETIITFTPSTAWIANIILGILWIIPPYFVIRGFNLVEVSLGSIVMLSEIIFAMIYAFLFFGEILTVNALVGGICILTAILVPEVQNYRDNKRQLNRR